MMIRFVRYVGLSFLIGAASAAPALAAPQILAVIASLGPQQMRCEGAICTTDLTTYCLQRGRDVPSTGQVYRPAAAEQIRLIVEAADGTEHTLPVDGNVLFRSIRGYTNVSATLNRNDPALAGAAAVRLEVAAGAMLIPEAVAGDPNPISEAELAFAANSLRQHGNEIVDSQAAAQSAAIVNRIATSIMPRAPLAPGALDQLWRDVIDGIGPARPYGTDALQRARSIYDWCQKRSSYHSMAGIKSCLEFKHDDAIMRLNKTYWDSQPGF